jgi:hypothetical protein
LKLLVKKDNDEVIIKEIFEGNENDFDYVKMINALFNKDEVSLSFTEDINKDDQDSINKMFEKINELSNKKEE